jgi:hypothetical protein
MRERELPEEHRENNSHRGAIDLPRDEYDYLLQRDISCPRDTLPGPVLPEEEENPYEVFEAPPDYELSDGERLLDNELQRDCFIGVQIGPSIAMPEEITVVDVARLEEEQREQRRAHHRERRRRWYQEFKQAVLRGDEDALKRRARARENVSRRYHETKQAALAGDPEGVNRWERLREQSREAQRRWRKNHPEEHRALQRAYKRRRKLRDEMSSGSQTEHMDLGE